jgi:GntR family transcriptional regulator, transcriptional repressor for pyruvate dehydrogenase complex
VSASPSIELGETVLRAVRGHHAFEGCVEQLATAIRLGVYPRGSVLPPERELADRLGVSRATLREAIAALRAADFVNTTRGRGGGTVVSYRPKKPSSRAARALGPRTAHLRDTLVFRRLVEPGACHIAASRELTVEQRDFLTDAHDEVAGATDAAEHRQADSRFHLAIAAVTESPMTVRSVTAVQADLHDMLSAIPVLEVNIEHSSRQHRAILDAILDGRATKARRVMESHCDDTAALLRGLLT